MVRDAPPSERATANGLRALLARNAWAMIAAAAATLIVELGVFLLAALGGAPGGLAAISALAAATLWVALAAPVLAAGAEDGISALLRAGTVVDAGAVMLLVLWIACPEVTFVAAAKVYCILACMMLPGAAAVRLGRSAPGRYALAVGAAALGVAALASPFWAGGPMKAVSHGGAADIAAACVYVNPFYAVTAALSDTTRFVWHQASVLYRITRLGDYASPPPPRWYASALLDVAAASGLLATGWLLRGRRS